MMPTHPSCRAAMLKGEHVPASQVVYNVVSVVAGIILLVAGCVGMWAL